MGYFSLQSVSFTLGGWVPWTSGRASNNGSCWRRLLGSVKTGSDEAFCGRHGPQRRLPRNDHTTAFITSSQHQLLLPLLPPLPPPLPPPRSPRISSHTKAIEKENPSRRSTTITITSAVATRTTSFPYHQQHHHHHHHHHHDVAAAAAPAAAVSAALAAIAM